MAISPACTLLYSCILGFYLKGAYKVLFIHGTSDQVALYDATETFYKDIGIKDKTFFSVPVRD